MVIRNSFFGRGERFDNVPIFVYTAGMDGCISKAQVSPETPFSSELPSSEVPSLSAFDRINMNREMVRDQLWKPDLGRPNLDERERKAARRILTVVDDVLTELCHDGPASKLDTSHISAAITNVTASCSEPTVATFNNLQPSLDVHTGTKTFTCGNPPASELRKGVYQIEEKCPIEILYKGETISENLPNTKEKDQDPKRKVKDPLDQEDVRYKAVAGASFSGAVEYGPVPPGTVLVRFVQQGSREPGRFWVELKDSPLTLAGLRSGLAVCPDWNQNGSLEILIVPSDAEVCSYTGQTAAQKLAIDKYEPIAPPPSNSKKGPPASYYLKGGVKQHFIDGQWLQTGAKAVSLKSCILVIKKTEIPGFLTGNSTN